MFVFSWSNEEAAPGDAAPSKGELAKQSLLAAGIEEFAERGVAGARVRRLAQRAGQNIAAISYHFGGKAGLYYAIADKITAFLAARLNARWQHAEDLLNAPTPDAPACARAIREILFGFIDAVLASEQTRHATLLLLREQQHPTPVFDLMYERVIEPTHDRITRLLAIVWQAPVDTLLISRAHAIVGQVFIFRAARATILRRTGWTKIGPAEIETIKAAIAANLDALLASPPPAPSASS